MASTDAPEENKKIVKLITSKAEEFEVEVEMAMQSSVIARWITESDRVGPLIFPITPVSSATLIKILDYWNVHAGEDNPERKEYLKKWDEKFVKMDISDLCIVLKAAHYLEIDNLLNLLCQTIADMIKGKTPEEIRNILHIDNDFTQEEMDQIKLEFSWAL